MVARVNCKLTGEKIDAVPVKLTKDVKKIKIEPLKVEILETKKSFESDSDFEWQMDDESWSVDEEVPEVTENPPNYENFNILITENHEVIIQNQPATKTSDHRKHPSVDPENEQKIRDFIDMKCHICNEKFEGENASFSKVKKHFKKFHPTEKGYLMCCDKKFIRRAHLLDHIEWHDKSKIHRCEICDKDYKNKACLKSHNKNCHSSFSQECICSECGMSCRNEITLKFHMKTHEVDSIRSYECFKCQKPFKNLQTLKNHFRSAHNRGTAGRQIVCEICSKIIKARYFRSHIKIHQANREKFKCDVCHRWILKESKMSHLKKHAELGVNCQLCGKYLKGGASYLATHMKIAHSENHRFKCDFCEKSYHKRVKLIEHVAARHTREILYRCRVEGCGKTFRAEGNWKVHEKKFHPDEYEKFFKPSYLRSPEEEIVTVVDVQ